MAGGKRVVFFDAYPHEVAGAQRATLLIMDGLRNRGWSVELAVPADGPFGEAAKAAGHAVTVLPVPRALRVYGRRTKGWRAVTAALALPLAWIRIARWFRARADIVHIADHRGQLLMGPAARLARRPVVWHIHGINSNRALNVLGSAFAQRVLVPSRAAANGMVGIERRRSATIVPNALPPDLLTGADRRPPTEPTAVTLTRLHPDKGLDILLRAVAALLERVPTLHVIVAGGVQQGHESYEAKLLDLRRELGLESVVDFAGRTNAPRDLLLRATMYVQSSREGTELQPISVLEAMALGVPVVATRVGGVAEMLGDGEFGTLVAPEDPAALAAAMEGVLRDRESAVQRAAAAQKRVRVEHTTARQIDQLEAVYASL